MFLLFPCSWLGFRLNLMEIWTLESVSSYCALMLCFITEGAVGSNPGNVLPVTLCPTLLPFEGGLHSVSSSQVELVKYEEGPVLSTYLFE